HLAFRAVDLDGWLPATLSRRVVTELLRERMGYRGLVVTDALMMRAIRSAGTEEQAVIRSLAAGCDVALYPEDPAAATRAIVAAVERGDLDRSRLDEAVGRVLAAKRAAALERGAGPTGESVGLEATAALALEVARRSLTLIGPGELPSFAPGRGTRFLLIDDDETGIGPKRFEEALRRRDPSASCSAAEGACTRDPADVVVLFTAVRGFRGRPVPGERAIAQVRAALARGRAAYLVLGTPFAAKAAGPGSSCLVAYGFDRPSIEAAVAALYGPARFSGRPPVRTLAT
ncbi:MAG TPA: glycoside hydrolase family 3 N-terminal domain-containing protein, partial [Planctomycetota bacterium]|nr:glycoside hydrolase family 3 N-terminal domain-containing protein [Planctomycetota bacterium]